MKVRAQIGMVLNLDKCIGCHTCSVTCKNVWTSRPGVEYAWFNNVETKPGIGYPKEWENQDKWNGGWVRKSDGSIVPRQGGKWQLLMKIFANPNLPEIDDYYEPFTFDYDHLHSAPEMKAAPTARPRSLITGQRMEKIEWGPNWEEILGGEFSKRSKDRNFDDIQKEIYGQFENTFMMYLPRLCEHCLNPACVASCPSGSIYKREEDGIVLIDQDKCRGWRMCVSGCPYKKIYYNWKSGKAEKCIFCYPRIEAGQPTVCSETCVGRIRYLGVLLYDADRIEEAASTEHDRNLYSAQLGIFLDPNDPRVIEQARADGIPEAWLAAAKTSPVYKMAVDWRVALPLHPEYRTLPMVWYIPPLSPVTSRAQAGEIGMNGELPDVRSLRIPLKYLANLLTAGDEEPVARALERMMAMRVFMRSRHVDGVDKPAVLETRRPDAGRGRGHVPRDGDRQLRGPLRHPDHASRVRRERLQRARRLRLLVRQRLQRGRDRDEPVRQREEAHDSDQGDGVAMRLFESAAPKMTHTLRALAWLLRYPDAGLRAVAPQLGAALQRRRRARARPALPNSTRSPARLAHAAAAAHRGRVRGTLRPRTAHCAAPVRARARRQPRSRPGDGRPRADLRARRPAAGAGRTARLPAGGAGVRQHAAAGGGARVPARDRAHRARDLQRAAGAQQPVRQRAGGGARPRRRARRPGPTRRRARARRELGRTRGLRRLSVRRPVTVRTNRSPSTSSAPPERRIARPPEETSMSALLNNFFFNVYPYICLAFFFMGSLARFDRDQYTWKSDSSQMLRARQLRWGSNLFHIGILFLLFGHTSAC